MSSDNSAPIIDINGNNNKLNLISDSSDVVFGKSNLIDYNDNNSIKNKSFEINNENVEIFKLDDDINKYLNYAEAGYSTYFKYNNEEFILAPRLTQFGAGADNVVIVNLSKRSVIRAKLYSLTEDGLRMGIASTPKGIYNNKLYGNAFTVTQENYDKGVQTRDGSIIYSVTFEDIANAKDGSNIKTTIEHQLKNDLNNYGYGHAFYQDKYLLCFYFHTYIFDITKSPIQLISKHTNFSDELGTFANDVNFVNNNLIFLNGKILGILEIKDVNNFDDSIKNVKFKYLDYKISKIRTLTPYAIDNSNAIFINSGATSYSLNIFNGEINETNLNYHLNVAKDTYFINRDPFIDGAFSEFLKTEKDYGTIFCKTLKDNIVHIIFTDGYYLKFKKNLEIIKDNSPNYIFYKWIDDKTKISSILDSSLLEFFRQYISDELIEPGKEINKLLSYSNFAGILFDIFLTTQIITKSIYKWHPDLFNKENGSLFKLIDAIPDSYVLDSQWTKIEKFLESKFMDFSADYVRNNFFIEVNED